MHVYDEIFTSNSRLSLIKFYKNHTLLSLIYVTDAYLFVDWLMNHVSEAIGRFVVRVYLRQWCSSPREERLWDSGVVFHCCMQCYSKVASNFTVKRLWFLHTCWG